jgi:hypothetical protein
VKWIRRNRFAAGAITIGAIAVIIIGIVSESVAAVSWTGLLMGLLVGGAIAADQRKNQ